MSTKKANIRTDLALEAKEIWAESADKQTALKGVEARDKQSYGFEVTTVKILDEEGEKELNKPRGTYVTIGLDEIIRREEDSFVRGVSALQTELMDMMELKEGQSVLVVGLGNPAITPDAIGPKTAQSTMVTRHLVERVPEHFGNFRQVSVLETGVLGTTGIESAEIIRAVTEKVAPDCVIVVDALASRRLNRVCRTIQLADTGIVPGSGVGNSRAAINRDVLGVPVVAIGVPTVVDAATLAADLIEQAGMGEADPSNFSDVGGSMIVTPKEIDSQVCDISKLIGYGINMALHEGISIEDINMFVG